MAAAVGIFSSILGMGQSAEAGAKGREAGELGAASIVSETQTNIEQTKNNNGQKIVEERIYDGKIISISSPRGKEGKLYELFNSTNNI